MRAELEHIARIERYLLNQMSTEEYSTFTTEMNQNENLKNDVQSQQLLIEGIQRLGIIQDIRKARQSIWMNKWLTIIGIVLLLAGSLWFILSSGGQERESKSIITPQKVKQTSTVIPVDSIIEKETTVDTTTILSKEEEVLQSKSDIKLVSENVKPKIVDSTIDFPKKQFQYFEIDPNKPNTITGEEGTILSIPAKAFDTEHDEKIKIGLKEYYSLDDIAFSNLTTETLEGQLLETGGMIYWSASNASSANLKLKADKHVEIKFPCKIKKEGMQLFYGDTINGDVKWELEQLLETSEVQLQPLFAQTEVFTVVENMPSFLNCVNVNQAKQQACTQEKIREHVQANLKLPKTRSEGSYRAYVSFQINEIGFVDEVSIRRGVSPEFDRQAIIAVKSLPQFKPGTQRGIAVKVQYTLPIIYNAEEDQNAALSPQELEAFNRRIEKNYNDRQSKMLGEIEERIESDSTSNDHVSSMLDYYVLSTNNIGAINCDRFRLNSIAKTNVIIRDVSNIVSAKMVFHDIRSVLSAKVKNSRFGFYDIPKNQKVSLMVLRKVNDSKEIALIETTSDNTNLELKFEPLTKEKLTDLRAYFKEINN